MNVKKRYSLPFCEEIQLNGFANFCNGSLGFSTESIGSETNYSWDTEE